MQKAYDLLYKAQPYLLASAVFIILCSVAVKFNQSSFEFVWKENPMIAISIVVIGLILLFAYIQIDKFRLSQLNQLIKMQDTHDPSNRSDLLNTLTNRQKEVYDLIIDGRTNKEIMSELFIEASTLKTHINHIYKRLGIKGRKQLKNFHSKDS